MAHTRWMLAGGVLLVAVALTYQLGSPTLFEEPNEGQYAEVAREMLARGDWVSPHLNDVLFLNKPPLLYWLIATLYALHGVSEAAARLPSVLMTLCTILLVYGLGRSLFDATTGLIAAVVYVSMPSTLIEARLVRPDSLLIASISASLLAFTVALRTSGPAQRRALYAMQIAFAAGLLAKGVVALLVPAIPMAAVIITERRSDVLRRLAAPTGWGLFLALVLPWHLAAAWLHAGFAWDYVVNQHLLFFFDRKLPRDSIPISLAEFWGAFAGRLFPWTALVPLAALRAAQIAWTDAHWRRGVVLALAWLLGTMTFFSAAVSRLEHYGLPALPAAALLVAVLLRGLDRAPAWRATVMAYLAILLCTLAASRWFLSDLLGTVGWVDGLPAIVRIGRAVIFFYILAIGAALLTLRWSAAVAAVCIAAASLATHPFVHRTLVAIAPLNSSAPVAQVVSMARSAETRVIFEAPVEYQHVAGLAFYLRQPVTLVRPDGFVEPTYLVPHRDKLFIDRETLASIWQRDPVLFVSDPLAPAERSLKAIVPEPFFIVAHVGNRWVVSNRQTHATAAVSIN